MKGREVNQHAGIVRKSETLTHPINTHIRETKKVKIDKRTHRMYLNIAKGTTDPGVDCFDQQFWFGRFGWAHFVW